MHARSALFDVYGDHLLAHGGWSPISALVGLLGSLGIAAPAVRTAVSRMVSEGWLEPEERALRGYAVSARGQQRLQEAHARIYRARDADWDGHWHLAIIDPQRDRSARERTARSLAYFGYGRLAPQTWVAPRPNVELADSLGGVLSRTFTVTHSAVSSRRSSDRDLAAQVWDLESLGAAYTEFARRAADGGASTDPESAFVERSELVHAWRLFLFTDPRLPAAVLPDEWAGRRAARVFDERQRALMPAARHWVDRWLAAGRP